MALFTIPTSIGGINIPGNLFGGPLGSLYQKNGLEFVQYPRDLGSSTKLHSVQFIIEEIKEIGLQGVKKIASDIGQGAKKFTDGVSWEGAANTAKEVVNEPGAAIVGAAEAAGGALGGAIKAIGQRSGTPVAYISLYMPETLNFSSTIDYDDSVTIASAAGALPLVGGVVSKITGALGNDAARLALNKAGYVFNPQKQMLFNGINFREFNMSFTFTPYSQREADDVKRIIKLFRRWAAPKPSTESAGMFWIPPALFGIEFQFQGKQNTNLPKLERCVVDNIDVNYAPNGWSAHSDGAPVQTTMTISFKEIVLIGRDKIEAGY